MRMQPGICMPLERYVPEIGAQLPGVGLLPAGVIVGINPYVIARNKSIWGEDVDIFRPERWLQGPNESEDKYRTRLEVMNNADLTFGAGSRACLGQHQAMLQVYKLVASLINRYDVELVNPTKDWKVINSWFMRQEGLKVMLKRAG